LGDEQIELRFCNLASSFGKRWLESGGHHPLQQLWVRRDALATNQLLLFGDAVSSFILSDERWLREKVNEIKIGPSNNRRGAIFEIFGINLLRSKNCSVRPTPRNYPGYDAILSLHDGATLELSLKSHGPSSHEQAFLLESRQTESNFLSELRLLGATEVTLRVIANACPDVSNWRTLRSALSEILKQPNFGIGPVHPVGNFWLVATHPSPQELRPLSENHLSYQILILAPYHQNESKNLLDKFESAAANARKHATLKPDDNARAVLIRLPETISLTACTNWAQEYVEENPDGPLDLIMLYQPTVVKDQNGNSSIDHGFTVRSARCFSKWERPTRIINMEPLIGVCSGHPTRRQLSGNVELPGIDTMYTYQRGEFFTVSVAKHDGTFHGRMDNISSGIVRHTVFRMPGGEEMTVRGIFPPNESLTLFD